MTLAKRKKTKKKKAAPVCKTVRDKKTRRKRKVSERFIVTRRGAK